MTTPITPNSINETLEIRGTSHGNFSDNAAASQALKIAILTHATSPLNPLHFEALDMICHKISRIICGDPDFKDHWHDIAGYSKLVADRC